MKRDEPVVATTGYETILRDKIIPMLERMKGERGCWGRIWEDAFCFRTPVSIPGLPDGTYHSIVVRTGELTVKRQESQLTLSIFDDRIKALYSSLEVLEDKIGFFGPEAFSALGQTDRSKEITNFINSKGREHGEIGF